MCAVSAACPQSSVTSRVLWVRLGLPFFFERKQLLRCYTVLEATYIYSSVLTLKLLPNSRINFSSIRPPLPLRLETPHAASCIRVITPAASVAPASRRTSRPIGLHSACSCTHTGRSNSTRTSALVCARRQRGLVAVGWPCSSSPATILRRVALPLLAWQYASKGWPRVSGTYMYGKLRPWYVRVGWCIMRESPG